jgi:hypothetical protein
MPLDLTAAHFAGRCRLYRTRAVSAEAHGQRGRAIRISRRRSTNLSLPLHAIYRRASGPPHDPT